MEYAFANRIGQRVRKSFKDPYDAYQNNAREDAGNGKELCEVQNGVVTEILQTKIISLKWEPKNWQY